jgi:hypothetical protein
VEMGTSLGAREITVGGVLGSGRGTGLWSRSCITDGGRGASILIAAFADDVARHGMASHMGEAVQRTVPTINQTLASRAI